MEITLLGPLTAFANGISVVPSATKPRQILALLALNSGRVVPVACLMEELWGANLPRSAVTTLQTYILQLRRKLRAAQRGSPHDSKAFENVGDVLVTRPGGYLLEVQPSSVDAQEFDRLTMQGYAAYNANDPETAARLLTRALALFNGSPLVDVQLGRLLRVEATRLQESRMAALERRIDAQLLLRRHDEVLGELAGLITQHPLHENLHGQFMIALYRLGRPAQALEVYRKLHAALLNELGLEPSARLQWMQRAILAADPALDELSASTTVPVRLTS